MQPLEIVRQWYQTREAALLHPELEWQVLERWPAGGTYHSPEQVLIQFFPKLLALFAQYQALPEHYYPSGSDTVLVSGAYEGIAKRTGKPFRSRFVHTWVVKDGQIIRFAQVADTAAVQQVL